MMKRRGACAISAQLIGPSSRTRQYDTINKALREVRLPTQVNTLFISPHCSQTIQPIIVYPTPATAAATAEETTTDLSWRQNSKKSFVSAIHYLSHTDHILLFLQEIFGRQSFSSKFTSTEYC